MNVLEVSSLWKTYEGASSYTALEDVSLSVAKGEFVGIMGPSGSGKSTLLNVVSTVDKPSRGTVRVDGVDPHGLGDEKLAEFRRRKMGFVFQDFNLVHTLTVEENIILPLALDGWPAEKSRARAQELARDLGIASILGKRTHEISGGQAQRVAIARAVAANPSLLLADEPTGSLDSASTGQVMHLLSDMNRAGATLLMVTHEPLVASYCSRVLVLQDGRIYLEINRGASQKEFHQRIIDAMNQLGGVEHDIA